MTSSKYMDKDGNPIQAGDVRITSTGYTCLILIDNYRDMTLIDTNLCPEECRTCELYESILIEHSTGHRKDILIDFINRYV